MRFAKRFLVVAGTAALAGILAIAIAPKTAHGLVATLVQITNGAANPVFTQDIRGSATQILELACPTDQGNLNDCSQVDPSTPTLTAYAVPKGQNFVVTQIETQCGGGGTDSMSIIYPLTDAGYDGNLASRFYGFPCNSTTVEFSLQPGLVIPYSGVAILASNSKLTSNPTYIRGYLTAN